MKALLLLSGGFDSAVAGYLMQKQGLEVYAVHFSYEPFTDNGPEIKAKQLTKQLGFKSLRIINISKECGQIARECQHRYYFVLTKRLMIRKATEIAKKKGYSCLLTGESLGQVGSQTLPNLKTVTEATDMKILRPLLTYDKEEIIKIAIQIGTYDISIGPEVCDVLGPRHPATRTISELIKKEEEKLK